VRSAPGAGTTITITMPLVARRRPANVPDGVSAGFVPA